MTLPELLLLSLALAVDAFSVGVGVALVHRGGRQIFRLSFHFGLFQGLFAGAGILAGNLLFLVIAFLDHWLAFGLLVWVGLRMIRGGQGSGEDGERRDPTRGLSLALLSTAVSIDAFAAGVSLAAMDVNAWLAVSLIALVSGIATWLAFRLTGPVAEFLGRRGERIAGVVLIGLGVKILVEHLLAG
jgi:manganese efflux pump family protein